MKDWWRRSRPELIGWLIYLAARLIGLTLRTKVEGWEKIKRIPGGKLLLTWHGRTVVPGQFFGCERFWVMVSHSRDGEIQNRILSRMGYQVIRGSTGRGGERALVESIRCLKNGGTMAMTPDGPRGPSGIVQPGVMLMAKKSRVPIVPVGISARPRHLARSWDRHLIPAPFAKGLVLFGKPIYIPPQATAVELEAIRMLVQAEMHRMQNEAERRLGLPLSEPDLVAAQWGLENLQDPDATPKASSVETPAVETPESH